MLIDLGQGVSRDLERVQIEIWAKFLPRNKHNKARKATARELEFWQNCIVFCCVICIALALCL